ncbi:hypothetical protein BJ508DRAFT_301644 [Ascobolus immersus RN42]|uniref:Uncharacterized protein n=1 Tax=Ascobolus immersus RN42 TaxID=1160509 RepID=A0A3N4IL19_ASCIM|nr:hypothetical protein BJ508DRAFT_301644 [Ascobolus immersus RN42]
MMLLHQLPAELQLDIYKLLELEHDNKTLAALSLVSQAMRARFLPMLFSRLALNLNELATPSTTTEQRATSKAFSISASLYIYGLGLVGAISMQLPIRTFSHTKGSPISEPSAQPATATHSPTWCRILRASEPTSLRAFFLRYMLKQPWPRALFLNTEGSCCIPHCFDFSTPEAYIAAEYSALGPDYEPQYDIEGDAEDIYNEISYYRSFLASLGRLKAVEKPGIGACSCPMARKTLIQSLRELPNLKQLVLHSWHRLDPSHQYYYPDNPILCLLPPPESRGTEPADLHELYGRSATDLWSEATEKRERWYLAGKGKEFAEEIFSRIGDESNLEYLRVSGVRTVMTVSFSHAWRRVRLPNGSWEVFELDKFKAREIEYEHSDMNWDDFCIWP